MCVCVNIKRKITNPFKGCIYVLIICLCLTFREGVDQLQSDVIT